ncbi:MAG: hypothetical protein OXT06_10480 [Rhodospirillaceae bacterium]|nr:hypothetical protein [Rhodospirillaceae bacterium]MDD9930086.1 hypothetical protein [Rhodospirillaceae bacterium]
MSARSDFISGLVMLACTAIFYMAALEIEEDPFGVGMEPYVFPIAICYVLGGITLLLLARSAVGAFREGLFAGDLQEIRLFFGWVLPMAAIAFAYLGLINLFQYLLPTIIILSATLALFGNRGVKWLVTIPTISGLVYYVTFFGVFRLLEPTGILIEYDNFYIFGAMRKFIGV